MEDNRIIKMQDLNELKYQLTRHFDIDMLENSAHAVGIYSEQDAKGVLSMALQARKIEKGLDECRSEIVKPHFDYQRDINKMVKRFKEKLEEIEEILRKKVEKWMIEQKDNPFANCDEIEVEDGKVILKRSWEFKVRDEKEVPAEYLQIDTRAIETAIKNGVRSIPGIEIFSQENAQMRVKN